MFKQNVTQWAILWKNVSTPLRYFRIQYIFQSLRRVVFSQKIIPKNDLMLKFCYLKSTLLPLNTFINTWILANVLDNIIFVIEMISKVPLWALKNLFISKHFFEHFLSCCFRYIHSCQSAYFCKNQILLLNQCYLYNIIATT